MRAPKVKKYNLNELMSFLTGDLNKNINELIIWCKELKMTPQGHKGLYDNIMRVSYKSRTVLTFNIHENGSVYLELTMTQPQDTDKIFAQQSQDIQDFFFSHLKGSSHIGENGYKLEFNNPTNEQIQYIKILIEIRRKYIALLINS